jgi:hypothetical protein
VITEITDPKPGQSSANELYEIGYAGFGRHPLLVIEAGQTLPTDPKGLARALPGRAKQISLYSIRPPTTFSLESHPSELPVLSDCDQSGGYGVRELRCHPGP